MDILDAGYRTVGKSEALEIKVRPRFVETGSDEGIEIKIVHRFNDVGPQTFSIKGPTEWYEFVQAMLKIDHWDSRWRHERRGKPLPPPADFPF
jgi:hypothetical protein